VRVVVTGATGNVGTSLVEVLHRDPQVDEVVGIARRIPDLRLDKVTWVAADLARDELVELVRGADVVVHLAWAIQPSHDLDQLRRINVDATSRLLASVAEAGVPALVYASSIGAYSVGPKDRGVDESWPTDGIDSSFYSRHKAEVERLLDRFESEHPDVRVVRLRKALAFKGQSGSGIARLFLGPFVPRLALRPSRLPVVPKNERLVFQVVHTDDAAEAYRLAVLSDVRGAFNIAADQVLDTEQLAETLGARQVPVASGVLRAVADVTWRLRLQPTPKGWVDMALGVPIMDTSRARSELGWLPRVAATDALTELLEGIAGKDGVATAPLEPGYGNKENNAP
jgi:UDP-glucose 4-epimerase